MEKIDNQSMPLISIIVPIYNVEQYLRQCLDSLLQQTYSNIEIVCVNDGSTDQSGIILQYYRKKDSRVKVFNEVNQGVSQARNFGMAQASGEYIMFVDGDDWLHVDTCKVTLQTLQRTDADVVMFPYVRENIEKSVPKNIFEKEEICFEGTEVKKKLHRRFIGLLNEELGKPENADALCPVWGKLYRTEIIKKHKLQFIDLKKIGTYEDGMLNLFYFEYVKKAIYINKHFYHYRKSERQSITSGYNPLLYKQWSALFHIMKRYIEKKKLPEEYQIAYQNRIALSILGLGLNISASEKIFFQKIKMLRKILISEKYQEAYKKLEFKYFPIHWKVFYGFAKYRCATGVYFLLQVINKLR